MASVRKLAREKVMDYVKKVEADCPELTRMGRNLTRMYLENKLDKVYYRDNIVVNIQKILLRKSKGNILLTGSAGCGKTAIAERLADVLANRSLEYVEKAIVAENEYKKKYEEWEATVKYDECGNATISAPTKERVEKPLHSEIILFEISLTTLCAGTKYRGDYEERLDNILRECQNNPNIILFIDEFHQIIKSGSTDNNAGAAQMLKPALARGDIRVIGATTTEEASEIWQDKAFARRFNEIKVEPLSGSSALETASKIMADYSAYHKVDYANINFADILYKLKTFLPKSVFPDNFINIVDEAFAGARFDNVEKIDMTHLNAVLSRMAGVVIL